jgi:hypothetical protein
MDRRRARDERVIDADHRGLGVDVEDHAVRDVLRRLAAVGDHGRDRLTDIGDAVGGEDRLGDRDIVGAVEERPDAVDAGKVAGCVRGALEVAAAALARSP